MARILSPDTALAGTPSSDDSSILAGTEPIDYEIVFGRRQVAGIAFLVLVILAACVGGAFLLGKKAALQGIGQQASIQEPVEVPPPPPLAEAAPTVEPAVQVTAPEMKPAVDLDKPLFGDPLKGVVYIQMGAVEKGIAELLAEGLRKRGFLAFVGPGPNNHIFRVLVGPFHSPAEYDAAKGILDRMGLESFSRRYEE